jgi:hypothetical protein
VGFPQPRVPATGVSGTPSPAREMASFTPSCTQPWMFPRDLPARRNSPWIDHCTGNRCHVKHPGPENHGGDGLRTPQDYAAT